MQTVVHASLPAGGFFYKFRTSIYYFTENSPENSFYRQDSCGKKKETMRKSYYSRDECAKFNTSKTLKFYGEITFLNSKILLLFFIF